MNELYHVSKLEKNDYKRGFLNLLEQLTTVNPELITFEEFCKCYDEMNTCTYVIRSISADSVVATGSLLLEKKFIHNLGSVGHIEDIVVDKKYSGMGLGKEIVKHLVKMAKEKGCYKIILNCGENNIKFYEKCGFTQKEIGMAIYF